MSLVATIIAVLCAIVLIIEMSTGSLTQFQVAGIGLLALAVAGLAPANWNWPRGD